MRSVAVRLLVYSVALLIPVACVDQLDETRRGRVNIVVVDGTITNLTEAQVVRLNRSRSDSVTGRFGTLPLTGATVDVVVDSSRVVVLRETEAGRYQAPDGFVGQVGHRYQLRFTLSNGQRYESTPEVMPAVPAIAKLSVGFNPISLPAQIYDGRVNPYRAANDFFVDWQDPVSEHNYYRWDWRLWERQDWCRTCSQGFYLIDSPFDKNVLYEACYSDEQIRASGYFVNDYVCRTACWEIIRNFDLNLFDDQLSNGGLIQKRRVAQIPYYQDRGCLVELRQTSLTQRAYTYFNLFRQQTQNSGGLADPPPTALIGNVRNVANDRENVVGYFTASAVAPVRYWLDRKQNTGTYPGLFRAFNGLLPSPEGLVRDPNTDQPKPAYPTRSTPAAPCVESDTRTQTKPDGWLD